MGTVLTLADAVTHTGGLHVYSSARAFRKYQIYCSWGKVSEYTGLGQSPTSPVTLAGHGKSLKPLRRVVIEEEEYSHMV